MKNQILTYRVLAIVIAVVVIFPMVACTGSSKPKTVEKAPFSTSLANPAAVKCQEDGFVLKPVKKDGVIIDHSCENPENGKNCGVWVYFRGECSLK